MVFGLGGGLSLSTGVQSTGPSVVGALVIRPIVAFMATVGLWGGVRHAIGRDPTWSFSRVWGAIYLALLSWDTVPVGVQLARQQVRGRWAWA